MISLLSTLALGAPSKSVEVDLDGDGKTESIVFDETKYVIRIGRTIELPCEGDGCDLEVQDISSSTPSREVAVCHNGPRDGADCKLYGMRKGKLISYDFPADTYGGTVHTSGNGIVLRRVDYAYRLFEQTLKYTLDGTKLVEVKQPVYLAPKPTSLHIEKTFPLLLEPESTSIVGNARPDSDISIMGAHGSKAGFLLVRLSSGISGYVHRRDLEKASQHYRNVMGAG